MKPTSPGRRGMVKVVTEDLFKGRPFAALLKRNPKLLAVTTTVTSPPVTSVVVTSSTTVCSTSSATKMVFLQKLNVSNTILTVPRTSLCCATPTANVIHHRSKGMAVGDSVMNGSEAPIKSGNCLPIRNIPVGTVCTA
jgi:large subunit ribosomal protein L2